MYAKDQEQATTSSQASKAVSRISVPELMHQLQVTQDELENLRVSYELFMIIFKEIY